MKRTTIRFALAAALAAMLAPHAFAAGGDDDEQPAANASNTIPTLNREQREAVGIVVAHPAKANPPEHVAAFGEVLDPASLIADFGAADASRAAERAAAAEVTRLQGLYKAGAGASLRNLEAAEAERARAHAEAETATAKLAMRWSPLLALPEVDRKRWIDGAVAGRRVLLRVDIPGRRSIGVLPDKAVIDVDGVAVEGRVLGVLASAADGVQAAGLLAGVEQAPKGFGAGARVPVTLTGGKHPGYLVPRGALIYEEGGTFVYHELAAKPGDETRRYARKPVTLLMQSGDGWLVSGLDDDDEIVVRGAGVLWSLEGIGEMPEDDDD